MEVITIKTRGERLLYSLLYAALGGLLFILPFFLLYPSKENLVWVFAAEVIILIGLYHYKRGSSEILGDLIYLKYDHKKSKYQISESLRKMVDEDELPGKNVNLGGEKDKRLGAILKNLASNRKANISDYNGGILSFEKVYFKIHLMHEGNGIILCIFQDISKQMKQYNDLTKSYIESANLGKLQSSVLRHIPVALIVRNRSMDVVYYNDPYYDLAIGPDAPFDESNIDMGTEYTKSAMDALASDKEIVTERSIILGGSKELYQITDIPDNETQLVISVFVNIKEVGKLKEIIRDLRGGVKNFLNSLDYACMVIDQEGYLKYFNNKLRDIWGIESDFLEGEVTHTEILDHLYLKGKLPAQSDYTKFKYERVAMHEGLKKAREDFFYLPDGTCVRSAAVPFEEGSVLFTYDDITHRLDVERSLKFANRVRDSIIFHTKEGVCIFDKDGRLEVSNENMIRIWNLHEESRNGAITYEIFIEKSFAGLKDEERAKVENAFTKALVSNIEVEQIIKGLNDKIIQRRISPLANKSIMIADQEVTEDFQKMESYLCEIKSLKAMDKDKSTFMANMPHKVRGAVNALIGLSHILLTQNVTNLSDDQSKYLKDLKSSADYISKIMDEAADLSEFKNLYDIPVYKELDLASHVKKVVKSLEKEFKQKNLKVKFINHIGYSPCYTDANRFENALTSVLQNSIYRSKPDGSIEIELNAVAKKFELNIIDDGLPFSWQKSSDRGGDYYSLSLTYARMNLEALDLELKGSYNTSKQLSTIKIELPNDRTFNQFESS